MCECDPVDMRSVEKKKQKRKKDRPSSIRECSEEYHEYASIREDGNAQTWSVLNRWAEEWMGGKINR